MNHVFASSHLPEDNRPQDEEEEEDAKPMLREWIETHEKEVTSAQHAEARARAQAFRSSQ